MERTLLCWLVVVALSGCTGLIETSGGKPELDAPAPPAPVDPALPVEPSPENPLPAPVGPKVFPPAGIRRLSQWELDVAAARLLGLPATALTTGLGADIRQSGFTRNGNQRVDSVQADALWNAAPTLAHQAVLQRLSALAPCATATGSEACAGSFIHDFAQRAFRRTPTPAEEAALLQVYRAGALDSTWASGIELVITAVLQSASFLYLTELGGPSPSDTTRLTGEELATSLAFLFTGAPADAALMAEGKAGTLDVAAGRGAAARRLLAAPAGRLQVSRLLLEWLSADSVALTPKDTALFPQWVGVRDDMLAESRAIIDAVVFEGDGTLESLLSSDTTVVTPALATFYGLPGTGRVTQPAGRRGLLLAGAFLSANAHPNETAPIKRAAAVRRKLLCQDLPLPSNLGQLVVPAPDPTRTTRERFAVHSASTACAGCHSLLDPIGFALESFDPVGRYRTTENGKPIDPSGTLLGAGDATGPFVDAAGLAARLASSSTVAACFERQLFRFASGRSDPAEERTFLEGVRELPSARDAKIAELMIDYAQSDSFVIRRIQ